MASRNELVSHPVNRLEIAGLRRIVLELGAKSREVVVNCSGGGALAVAPYLLKLTSVHPRYLFPIILCIIFVGVYARSETLLQIILVVIFGLLGFFMKRFDYPRPAFALGFVLGGLFEYYLHQSIMIGGSLFFLRPISLGLIALTIGVLSLDPIRSALKKRRLKRIEEP